ncbi:hypothetical protein LTR04_001792 [Oleoguttula sp. CCFEE 6159]|nr:hypothetical protein LTR04_001792 [Oleoguttula sp. CCFEE 6159]
MNHSRSSSGPILERKHSNNDRKRKLQGRPPAQDTITSSPPSKQQTISDLFSSQQKPGVSVSPNSKRHKPDLDHTDLPPPQPPATPPKAKGAANMYKFTSNSKVIDLTDSPTSSPGSRIPERAKPSVGLRGGSAGRPNLNPHTGAKKLVVKNLRAPSKWDSKQYLESVWQQLDGALSAIFGHGRERNGFSTEGDMGSNGVNGVNKMNGKVEGVTFSMEELYRGVENLCRQGHAAEVCQRLISKCKAHISNNLKQSLLARRELEDVDMLRAVLSLWETWNRQLVTVQSIFFFLDRAYLLQSSKPSIHDMAVTLFLNSIFEDPNLKSKIIDGACDLVAADRMEDSLDHSTFRKAIEMFHDLGTYTSTFEPRMLSLSQSYIAEWAEKTGKERDLAGYVNASVQFMQREMGRCEMFGLDATTRRDLALLEDHLVQRQESFLTSQDSIDDLLDTDAVSDLEALYSLLQRRHLGNHLRKPFESWINLTGTYIIFDDAQQDQMVVRLLSLKRRLDTIWRVSFHRDEQLSHALRESFETFINKTKKGSSTWNTDNSKPGEMIAKYVDMLLRGGAKAIPAQLTTDSNVDSKVREADDADDDFAVDEEAEVNRQLDQVLDLFRFVHGKAVFEAFYKKDLARRLLMGRSASADAERSMLARLKTECGAGFTQNLEQMFKDVELSREEMSSYKSRLDEMAADEPSTANKLDLSVSILSAAAWPTYPTVPVIIPSNIQAAVDRFELHYKSKHSGRKLEFKHALAHCQMKAAFPRGAKEIVVSSFQAVVLLLFNSVGTDEHLTYDFVKAESGLSEAEVKRTLQSLACAKLRPLTKHPKGRDINDTDTFTLNAHFTHDKYRVKINQVQLKETKEENKETHERVAADRNFECQAAIVRIMKSRKTISHAELVSEVISATRSRGVLAVGDIKKNIDRLIEKEYMEREEGGKNSYSYIA